MTTQSMQSVSDEVGAWFEERLPGGWFAGSPEIGVDHDEILVVGRLATADGDPADATHAGVVIRAFREETRDERMAIAAEAERRFERRVSWGAEVGERRELFTTVSAPVMTRLRLPERRVLDTLVEAGVARSRSEALGWCVRLVGRHEGDWLQELRDALVHVQRVRAEGPTPV